LVYFVPYTGVMVVNDSNEFRPKITPKFNSFAQ
jgi:hypothetical protein